MAAPSFPPMQIDQSIQLPPIPGHLPDEFFRDFPSDAPAIFSTSSGTKSLRNLNTATPVHLIQTRQTSDDDIIAKAWSLMIEHPEIAESVRVPTAWKDLYNYFDAVDLWKEGPGFLFRVLGYIHRVNVTRLNCIQGYVRDWVALNEVVVVNISATEDPLDVLTPDSRAYFDIDNLTKGEVDSLRSAIMWHRNGLQQRQEADRLRQINDMRMRALRDPSIVSMERQRPYGNAPVNSNNCGPTHTYVRNMVDHPNMTGYQAHSRSNSYYHTGDFTQSHANPYFGVTQGPENTIAQCNGTQNNHIYGHPTSPNDMYGGVRGQWHSGQFGGQQVGFTGFHPLNPPVYVFNPQKPVGGHCGGYAAAEIQRKEQISSFRSEPSYIPTKASERVTQASRTSPKYQGISNDARLHYNPEYRQRRESVSQKVLPMVPNQPLHKTRCSRDGFAQACTVFVGGFRTEEPNTDWVPRLLSECGRVINFKPLGGNKNSGFVTFDNVESTFRAIERFNGFYTWEGQHLIVAHPRPRGRDGSYPGQNSGEMNRASSHNLSHDSPPARNRDRQHSDSRNAGPIWPHSRESSFYGTPPKYFSPPGRNNHKATARANSNTTETDKFSSKLQAGLHLGIKTGQAEDCFQTQLDAVAKSAGHNAVSKETTPGKSAKSIGSSGQTSNVRHGTVKKRKNFSKSGFATNTPTQSPSKKSLATPKAGPRTPSEGIQSSVANSVKPTSNNSNRSSPEDSQIASSISASDELSSSQLPMPNNIASAQQGNPRIIPSATTAKREQFAGKYHEAVVHQAVEDKDSAKRDEINQNRTVSLTSSLESGETVLSDDITSTNISVRLSTSNEVQDETGCSPKRRRRCNKRLSRSNRSSKGSIDEDRMVRVSTEKSAGENSEESFSRPRSDSSVAFSHTRSESDATTMSAFSSQGISSQGMPLRTKESSSSEDGEAVRDRSTSAGNASNMSFSPSSKGSNSVKQGGKPKYVKVTSSDDVFGDSKMSAVESSSEIRRPRHTKANSGSSGKSSTRLHQTRNQDGSPTPGKKVKSTSQRKNFTKKDVGSRRIESDRAQVPMLADKTHWPELGSSKPANGPNLGSDQATASVTRSFGQPVSSVLPRRDSSASVISESPQQP